MKRTGASQRSRPYRENPRSSYFQATVEDALALVSSFNDVKFNFCFRGCNEVAHRMAKWTVTTYSDKVWQGA
ncbi:HTH-type transcriptional regulator RafR [Bienertia sinuspersici]